MKSFLCLIATLALSTGAGYADSSVDSAALIKSGVSGGTLYIGGSNPYNGTTSVSTGTLQSGNLNDSALIFSRADTTSVASPIVVSDTSSGFIAHALSFNGSAGYGHGRITSPYIASPTITGAGVVNLNSSVNFDTSLTLASISLDPVQKLSGFQLSSSTSTTEAIPEPTSAALLTLAALGLLAQRRRTA